MTYENWEKKHRVVRVFTTNTRWPPRHCCCGRSGCYRWPPSKFCRPVRSPANCRRCSQCTAPCHHPRCGSPLPPFCVLRGVLRRLRQKPDEANLLQIKENRKLKFTLPMLYYIDGVWFAISTEQKVQRFDDIFRDNQFYADSCRTFCRESSCAKTSSVRCGYGLVRSFVLSAADFWNIVQYFSATGKYFWCLVRRNLFLCRNECIDGWMGRILHIA